MAYAHTNSKGRTYYLHSKEVMLRSGKKQEIYYFAKAVQPGALHVLPSGKIVVENEKTGLPVLKSEQPKGNTNVLEGEQIRVKVENNGHSNGAEAHAKEEVSNPEILENEMNTREEIATREEVVESNDTNKKNKIHPLAIALLPGQLLVVAAAKLMMSAFSKPEKPEDQDPVDFQDL